MDFEIVCTSCRSPFDETPLAHKCPKCGGLFDYDRFPAYDPVAVERGLQGLWRYRAALGLPEGTPAISLGEGDTPLVEIPTPFGNIHFKLEFLNPSGSHKDRGVAVMAGYLKGRGVSAAVEDSSGNAGASFAAYAARAGIAATVYVPAYASGPKRRQIAAYGAAVVAVPGKRSDVTEAVLRAVEGGAVYASHAYRPQLLPGYATAAYEIYETLGRAPAVVIAPAGQGSLLLGIGRGFKNLLQAGLIDALPRLVGVQATACAPLWAFYNMGPAGMQWVTEGETLAEGVRVRFPLWGDPLVRLVADSQGAFIAVDEERITPARDALAAYGLYVEPTSAIVWDALRQIGPGITTGGPVVAVLTGSGLKSGH